MERRELGDSGVLLTTIGLGCNNFGMKLGVREAADVVHAALDAGVGHFDTAEMYGDGISEEVLGRGLGSSRAEVTIATKFSPLGQGEHRPGDLARHIKQACDGSLRRLKTDHIDVYYQHFVDPRVSTEELFSVLTDLVTAGKVRHIAASNSDADYLRKSSLVESEVKWRGIQTEWSLLARDAEKEVVPAAVAAGLGGIPYFPLASGLLTGKYQQGKDYPVGSRLATFPWAQSLATERTFEQLDLLEEFAQSRGRTLLELALGWLLSRPGVTSVIAGATTPEQVTRNVAASTWRLHDEEMAGVAHLLARGGHPGVTGTDDKV